MAKLHVTLLTTNRRGTTGVNAPDSLEAGADTKTLSGTSQPSDLTGQPGQTWRVVGQDGSAFIKTGAGTPTAASDTGHLIPPGIPLEFNVTVADEKLAMIESV
jgi:hypothetical protein